MPILFRLDSQKVLSMFHKTTERRINSKPRKATVESVLANHPEILAQLEKERATAQRNWEADLIGELADRGIPVDIATVAARHSRLFETGHERAANIVELLAELQRVWAGKFI